MEFLYKRMGETDHSTWGIIDVPDGRVFILERGLRNLDHPRISAGSYEIARKPIGTSEFDRSFKTLLGPAAYKGILWFPHVLNRTNIEIHTANFIEQLLGCLATGMSIAKDGNGDFSVPGGQSSPAYKRLYLAISAAIDAGGASLSILDIPAGQAMV